MRLLDMFCGRWGWSRAFAARGWECWGIDLVSSPLPAPNAKFSCLDILDLSSNDLLRFQPNFIVASPPCEEFSVHGMKNFHPNPKYPEMGIRLFNHTRLLCEASGLPYVIENVRAAQQFVGNAAHHCGPFYLWGNAVPPFLPQGLLKGRRLMTGGYKGQTAGKSDKAAASIIATIPAELANVVAAAAENLLTMNVTALKQRAGGAHLEETHIEEK